MIGQEFILSVLESDALPEVEQALSDSSFVPTDYPCVYCEEDGFNFGQLTDDGDISSVIEPYTIAVIVKTKNLNDTAYGDAGSRQTRKDLFTLAKKVAQKIIDGSKTYNKVSYVEFGKAEIINSKIGSQAVMIIQFPAEVTVTE